MKISNMSVELVDVMGTDLSVVNAARVSFAKDASNFTEEQNNKLIKYLAKHGHWSPFAHAFLSFRIKVPLFVGRQLQKHQVGLSWNEVSRRYVDDAPEFYVPSSWRARPESSIKQGSSTSLVDILIEHGTNGKNGIEDPFLDSIQIALEAYNHMLNRGVAPEQARMILPQNMMTEFIWSGSLMAFVRVVKQRSDPHAQQESQEVAAMLAQEVSRLFPVSFEALMEN